MLNRKANRVMALVLLVVGFSTLFRILGNPRVAELHGSDIMALTGCGACIGVAIVGVLGRIHLRND